ncbi:MAG: type II toxin-antitoxin system CcdA family antitoxin [Nitrincola lacisaponensis]
MQSYNDFVEQHGCFGDEFRDSCRKSALETRSCYC